ncbi:E3 ubiquitin-protein ligase [Nymphaea thermarum]|nr:E3 ubiquitin-protein ligase [Nymphaea thermarum]
MSIMEYLGRLKGIVDQLGVAGYVVSEKEKVQQTLSGFGPNFYAFTTALEVLPILPTFNELQSKLLQHEMNMKQLMRGTNQGNAHNVLVMEAAAGHRKGNGAHQGGMNRGHDEQTGKGILPTPSVTRRFQTNITKKVLTCFQCNKKGHIKANCWFNPQNRSNKPEADAQQILMTALSKMTVKQNDQGEWYLDSGAATHVTRNAGQVYTRQKRRRDDNPTSSHVEVYDQPVRRSVRVRHPIHRWAISKPAAWHRFGSPDVDDADDDAASYFISAVCWKSDSPTMLTANSQGTIKVLVLAP